MTDLDEDHRDRYSRHVVMDDIGQAGQKALLDAEVLVVGAGGLGSAVIQYLGAAGVGTLHLVDDDVIERSNLQRQTLHRDADEGRPKVDSAAEFVRALNPDVDVIPHEVRFTPENAEELVEGVDYVVDCTDNFRARYVLNDACTLAGVPLSHGAVFEFEGQVTTFEGTPDSPCYRCLYPEAPPEDPESEEDIVGIMSAVPGTIGTIQATETIKGIVGAGTSLDGRLLFYDAERMDVEEVEIRKNPDCPVCGVDSEIDSLADIDYADGFAID